MHLRWLALSLALLAGCGGDEPASTAPADKPAAAPEKPSAAPAPKADVSFDPATLQSEAESVALVPSPAEMEKALAHAGIGQRLADMVKDRDITMDVENRDQIAVRTGVVMADLVLTIKDAPKDKVVARLGRLKEGFNKLGGGDDIQATIDDLIARVNNDAVGRDDLLREMDELSGVLVPELEYEAGDWVVPLIQAGSWLEGAHLVSGALKDSSKFESADNLLRQPVVVNYFLKYVQREGREKAPDEVVTRLEETLKTLKEITAKPKLVEEDVATIHSATGAVLTML